MKNEEHKTRVILYTLGVLTGLKEKGLVKGGESLNAKGMEEYRVLKESGFRPTDEELRGAIAALLANLTHDVAGPKD